MTHALPRRLIATTTLLAALLEPPAVRAQSAPAPGPCEQAAIGALVDRPGIGRPTANSGSPCSVPVRQLVIEAGYRLQQTTTSNGVNTLSVYPLLVARAGIARRVELIVEPPPQSIRTGGGSFGAAVGAQDAGFGVKRTLDDRGNFQDSIALFYTVPTGTPRNGSGFSAGRPTYALAYTTAFALSSRLSLSATQTVSANAAPRNDGGGTRFWSYQPSISIGYACTPVLTLILSDQVTAPTAPSGSTGNRAFIALQRTLSPAIVIDAEFEFNALPAAPANSQHAYGVGMAVRL